MHLGQDVNALNDGAGHPLETYVNIVVTGDVGDVAIAKWVNSKIWFAGNMSTKAHDLHNLDVDGPGNGCFTKPPPSTPRPAIEDIR